MQALKVLRTADFAPIIVFIGAPSVTTIADVPCANVSSILHPVESGLFAKLGSHLVSY